MNYPKKMRTDDLRTQNRHLVLNTLRSEGSLSRAEIGKLTGLSQAALSTLFVLMTEQGIVTSETANKPVQKRGRPRTTITLDASASRVVTVALTINNLSFNLVDYGGKTLNQTDKKIDTKKITKNKLVQTICDGIEAICANHQRDNLHAICIGFQGVTDSASGVLLWSPILSVEEIPVRSLLNERFNVPVIVNNDCGLIANALHKQEADKLGDSFATVLFSHGIGLGLYLGGSAFTGAQSSALELGHVCFERNGALCRCGKKGCIEAYAADYGIFRAASKLPKHEIPTGKITNAKLTAIINAASNHGSAEQQAFEQAGKAIGFGLATVFTLLDPLPVALVGHNTDAVNLMRNEIASELSTLSRGPENYSTLVHCYSQDKALLHDGLIIEALELVDRVHAEIPEDSLFEYSAI